MAYCQTTGSQLGSLQLVPHTTVSPSVVPHTPVSPSFVPHTTVSPSALVPQTAVSLGLDGPQTWHIGSQTVPQTTVSPSTDVADPQSVPIRHALAIVAITPL